MTTGKDAVLSRIFDQPAIHSPISMVQNPRPVRLFGEG
jgi:hypothetical protein